MNKGGKPKHAYWEEGGFVEKRNEKGKLVAQCKNPYCKRILHNTAIERLKNHRKDCLYNHPQNNAADDSISRDESVNQFTYRPFPTSLPNQTTNQNTASNADPNCDHLYAVHGGESSFNIDCKEITPSIKTTSNKAVIKRNQTKVKAFLDSVNDRECAVIDEALMCFFVANKIDFKVAESVYFKKFLNTLRPAYEGPSTKRMSNELLDNASNNLFKTGTVENTLIPVLLISNVAELTIIAVIRNMDKKYVFVHVSKCDESSKLKLNIFAEIFIRQCVYIVYTKMKLIIHSLVYDLELSLPHKMNITLNDTETEILTFKCQAQIIKSLNTLLIRPDLCESMNKLFNAFPLIKSKIKVSGKSDLLTCNIDKWSDYHAALEACSKNFKIMKESVGKNYKVPPDILQLVFDETFEEEINKVLQFSESIQNLTNNVLETKCNISEAIQYWFDLIDSEKNEQFLDIINEVFKSVSSPIHLASNYLNPKYRGAVFMNKDIYANMVEEFFVDNLSADGMNQYVMYVSQKELFSKLFNKDVNEPQVFWTLAARKYNELAKLAKKLLEIPASVPRIIDSTIQNYFTEQQQQKLESVFYQLKINESAN